MNNQQKIDIAKTFVSSHKNDAVSQWDLRQASGQHYLTDDEVYLKVFTNLEAGVYGNVVTEELEFQVEISSHDSWSGTPIIFEWEITK